MSTTFTARLLGLIMVMFGLLSAGLLIGGGYAASTGLLWAGVLTSLVALVTSVLLARIRSRENRERVFGFCSPTEIQREQVREQAMAPGRQGVTV
jgi:membrane protein implicated in regulation of membrane protease activity